MGIELFKSLVKADRAKAAMTQGIFRETALSFCAGVGKRDGGIAPDHLAPAARNEDDERLGAALTDPHSEMLQRSVPKGSRAALRRLRGFQCQFSKGPVVWHFGTDLAPPRGVL
jgi:hypothetical protein